MEVLDVAEEDKELVHLFFEDVFALNLKDHEYLPERRSLVLYFSGEEGLQKALAKTSYEIDDNLVFSVRKYEKASGQSRRQKAAAIVKPRPRTPGQPQQSMLAVETLPIVQGDAVNRSRSDRLDGSHVDKKIIDFGSSEKELVAGMTTTRSVPAVSVEYLAPMVENAGEVRRCIAVPMTKCGLIIGKGGSTIRDINAKSGAYVRIQTKPTPVPEHGIFDISGTAAQVECARQHMSRAARMHLSFMESAEINASEIAASAVLYPSPITQTRQDSNSEGASSSGYSRAVEVTGIASSTSRKCLEVYFRDELKSCGGCVEYISYVPDSGRAIVMFEDPAVASRVVAKASHVVQGANLHIRLRESEAAFSSRKANLPTYAPAPVERMTPRRYVDSGRSCPEVPSSVDSSSAGEAPSEQGRDSAAGVGSALIDVCNIGPYVCAEAVACWLKLATGSLPHTVCYAATAQRAVAVFDRADVCSSELTDFAKDNPLNGQTLRLQSIEQWSTIQVLATKGPELVETSLKEKFPAAADIDIQTAGRALVKFASHIDADQALSRAKKANTDVGLCIVPYIDDFGCVEREQVFCFDEARAVLRAKSLRVLPQLVVLGIAAEIDDSLLEKFFSNTPKTGGGRIRSFVCNNGRAVITYVQADDSLKVLDMSKAGRVSFCDRKLRVAVKQFPSGGHYKDRVLLRNLAELSLDEIKYLVWTLGGCKVKQVEFVRLVDSGELCASVQLDGPSCDFGRLSHGLQVLRLNGAVLELDFVPVSCSILLKKVPANAHKDLVELACASAGRTVESCERCASAHEWKVTFADPADAERALSAERVMYDSRTAIEVSPYLTYRPAELLPHGRARRELLLTFASASVLRFVLDRRPPGLDDLLLRHGCSCAFLPCFMDGVSSEPVAITWFDRPPWDPTYKQLYNDWHTLRLELVRFLHEFTEASIAASAAELSCTDDRLMSALKVVLDDACKRGEGKASGSGDDGATPLPPAVSMLPVMATIVDTADGGKIVRCVGHKTAVSRLKDHLRMALNAIRNEVEKLRTMSKHTVKDFEPWFVELLAAADFQQQLQQRRIDAQLVTNVAQQEITLIGAKAELDKAGQALTVARQQAFTEQYRPACRALYSLLSKVSIKTRMDQALAADQLSGKAIWQLEPPGTVVVHAINLMSAKKAMDCIKRRLSFRAVRLPGHAGESGLLEVDVDAWKEAVLAAAGISAGFTSDSMELELTEAAADGSRDLIIACEAATIDVAEREIRRLSSHHTIERARYRLHPLVAAYLDANGSLVRSLEEAHSQNHVTSKLEVGPSPSLTVEGNSIGAAAFMNALRHRLALDKFMARIYALNEAGASAHFASASAADVLQGIAKSTGTMVRLGDALLEQQQPSELPPTSSASADCGLIEASDSTTVGNFEYILPDGLVLCARQGNMTSMDCDVMVSSTNRDLAHSTGLAKAIADAGGDSVVGACRSLRLRQGVLSEGTVVETIPGRLPCKLLLHAVAPVWREGMQDEEGKLRRAVSSCMGLCDERQLKSISVPAIGCGARGYPPEQAVSIIVDEVKKYLASKHSAGSTIQKIAFVDVNGDRVQQFCSAIEEAFRVSPSKTASKEPTYIGVHRRSSKTLVVPSGSGAASVILVQQVPSEAVDFITGSLEDQLADVLVAPVASDLDLSRGRVSSALLDAAGPDLEAELKRNNPYGIPEGHIAVTSAHSLQCSLVFFAHCPEATRHADSQERLRKLILECLQEAEQRGKRSIALPALGTGHGHFAAAAAASAMADAVDEYRMKNRSSRLRIMVVVGDPRMVADYRQRLVSAHRSPAATYESSSGGRGTETFVWKTPELQDAATSSSKHPEPKQGDGLGSTVLFTICGTSTNDIASAAALIGQHCCQHMQERFITKPKDIVSMLSKSQVEDLQSYGRRRDVGVSLESGNGEASIALRSLDLKSMLDVMQLFNDALVSEHDAQVADEDLFKSVRWRYKDDSGEWHDYSPSLNRRLEEARKAKQPTVKYRSQSIEYTVDLDASLDTCGHLASTAAKICRETVSATSVYPATWSPSQSYLEVALKEQSQEYKRVYSAFILSLQQVRHVCSIKRIQNPPLWQQYAALRKEVEGHVSSQSKDQVERFLWHGAPEDAIEHICHSRFDRSHCGKNAVAYGQGVYFARDASYSAQDLYSSPNLAGEKHVIYCQVLTGDFEIGNQNMRVPNIKPGQTMVRYDSSVNSVSNPSIFVTYHDAQAYPAYVIKFE